MHSVKIIRFNSKNKNPLFALASVAQFVGALSLN